VISVRPAPETSSCIIVSSRVLLHEHRPIFFSRAADEPEGLAATGKTCASVVESSKFCTPSGRVVLGYISQVPTLGFNFTKG
jgi:hypothetical protein